MHFQSLFPPEKGKNPMQAALDGTMEVIRPVFTSVLTTVLAFSTLLFVGGQMQLMQEMAFTVIAALLFSLLEVFLILPSHLAYKRTKKKQVNNVSKKISSFKSQFEDFVSKSRDFYTKVNTRILKNYRWHVWTPFALIIVVLILSIAGAIRFTFFPPIPFNEVMIEFAYKPGEREFRSKKFLQYCDAIVTDYHEELIYHEYSTLMLYQVNFVSNQCHNQFLPLGEKLFQENNQDQKNHKYQ